MPHLLIAFDGSPSARAAIERSAELMPGAEASVVAVASGLAELQDSASTARLALSDEVIRTAVDQLRTSAVDGVRASAVAGAELAGRMGLRAGGETATADGPVWEALVAAARRKQADAIVCGTHGHGRAARAILGSVSSALVRHADVPVLVVPDDARPARGPVVIAFDDSEPAARAIAGAGRLLGGHAAVVVHAWRSEIRRTLSGQALARSPLSDVREIVAELDGLFESWGREQAERGAALAREHGLDARAHAVESDGPAARAILDAGREEDAAAIVVGRRGRGAVAAAVLGSVSASVLHAADRPVLVG